MSEQADRGLAARVLRDPLHWLAFGFGAGLLPLAPGTWGSLLGVLFYWLLEPLGLAWYLTVVALFLVAGIRICGESSRRLGVHDHPGIVWDEVVGMMLSLAVVERKLVWILAAFIIFRVADIWKPWPIRDLDHRLQGGLGIMLDDVMAAAYAGVALVILQFLIPG
jgi:phosphatidylglycerophosphatase A